MVFWKVFKYERRMYGEEGKANEVRMVGGQMTQMEAFYLVIGSQMIDLHIITVLFKQ